VCFSDLEIFLLPSDFPLSFHQGRQGEEVGTSVIMMQFECFPNSFYPITQSRITVQNELIVSMDTIVQFTDQAFNIFVFQKRIAFLFL
jgi:hypothetical protein